MSENSDPHRRSFASGDVIFEQNAPGDIAYIIESGHVTVTRRWSGRTVDIASLGVGEIVGERALIDDFPRTATATATVDTEVFIVERELLQGHLGDADPLISMLVRVLIDRLRTVQHLLVPFEDEALGFPGAERRRARRLAEPEILALRRFKREHELKRGIERGEFKVTLQPIVRLADGKLTGFEALMVWHHPSLGRVGPGEFIEIAERSGLVRDLDDLALRSAVAALDALDARLGDPARELTVSVNLSGAHAGQETTVTRVADLLAETGAPASRITLEITESWLVVESRRGAVAWALWASLRFLSPLIKPDVRISRIRLPDRLHLKAHGGGPRWTRLCRITPSSPNTTVSGKPGATRRHLMAPDQEMTYSLVRSSSLIPDNQFGSPAPPSP